MTTGILPLLLALSNEAPIESVHGAFGNFSSEYLYGEPGAHLPDVSTLRNEYDFVVVGAGTSGCVVANRLSENRAWNVLLLEAGAEENFLQSVPLLAVPLFGRTSANKWKYPAEPSEDACLGAPGGVCVAVKGRGLGGLSSQNNMLYTRAHQRDFDNWASDGNYGWSYREVLPYFVKAESSYVKLSFETYGTPILGSLFESAVPRFGYKAINPFDKVQLGFYRAPTTTSGGQRFSAARDYLHPVRDRDNLHVSMNSVVTKILIDPATKCAYGVEFTKNGVTQQIRAKKEVILAAGVIASPQLLMLSGVGPRQHLESLSIPVVQSLDVGFNLHDHYIYTQLKFRLDQPGTINPHRTTAAAFEEYITNWTGPFSTPAGNTVLGFIKTPKSDLPVDYPDIGLLFRTVSLDKTTSDRNLQLLGLNALLQGSNIWVDPKNDSFSVAVLLLSPKSRGQLSLRSTNPLDKPRLKLNFFDHPSDLTTLIEGIKAAIQIGEAPYGSSLDRTPTAGCDHLVFGSDEYLRCSIRQQGSPCAYQCGTCKMGPRSDPSAVVDPELRVHGVGNLRVADASVLPAPFAGLPNAVLFMVGEKLADMVKEYWKEC